MFWLILAIIVVGYFIVQAIHRNTMTNAHIAQQTALKEAQEKEASPENIAQRQVSLNHLRYLEDKLDVQIRIVKAQIRLINTPRFEYVHFDNKTGKFLDKTLVLTADKEAFAANKDRENLKLVTKAKIIEKIKDDIDSDQELLKSIDDEYRTQQQKYPGFVPEDLDLIRTKYELDTPFPPDYEHDYFNEDNASSWSMYQDRQREFDRLRGLLTGLKNPSTRQKTLELMALPKREDGTSYDPAELYDEAVRVVREAGKGSTALLQRRLRIGYATAAKLIGQMEDEGVVGPADGSRPREVPKTSLPQSN